MKLLSKTAIYLCLASLPIAILGVFALNWFIHKSTIHEIDELLISHFKKIENKLKNRPNQVVVLGDLDDNPYLEIVPKFLKIEPIFLDSTEIDLRKNEQVKTRILKATVITKNQNYLVITSQSYEEFEEISTKLSWGLGLYFLGFLLVLLLINFLVYRQLWKPFYEIINHLRNYQLHKSTPAIFKKEATEEFNLLSQTLHQMTERISKQFTLQKEFTENASHEIQTPIAVISAELETLLGSGNLPEKEVNHIQKSMDALQKLSQLNKSLLLLTKIENNQFSEAVEVDLSRLVENLLAMYQDFADHKNISIRQEIQAHKTLKINPLMAEILVGNLLKNAIRYNQNGGDLTCVLKDNQLIVSNKGNELPFPETQLFNRFVKHPQHPESTGLGLAIVKQIAEQYGLKITYQFDKIKGEHTFTVVM
jgi:signal transduction histidine kinase